MSRDNPALTNQCRIHASFASSLPNPRASSGERHVHWTNYLNAYNTAPNAEREAKDILMFARVARYLLELFSQCVIPSEGPRTSDVKRITSESREPRLSLRSVNGTAIIGCASVRSISFLHCLASQSPCRSDIHREVPNTLLTPFAPLLRRIVRYDNKDYKTARGKVLIPHTLHLLRPPPPVRPLHDGLRYILTGMSNRTSSKSNCKPT